MNAPAIRQCCFVLAIFLSMASPGFPAEKLIGLQSAPSVAMALPWFAEEARLYSKHDLDFQLVYIASSGIVTAAMSSGNGNVGIVGGEGPMRAYLAGNTDFVFIGSIKNVLTHSIMGKPDIKRPEDLKGRRIGVGRIGGNGHYFAIYGLRAKGLDPLRDVNLIQTGGAPETIQALMSGAVDAASVTTPQDTRAAFAGYNYVIDGPGNSAALYRCGFCDAVLVDCQTAESYQPVHAYHGRVAKNDGKRSRIGF